MTLSSQFIFLASILFSLVGSSTAATLNLFDIQPINDFPTECTAAYDVDIADCDVDEISTNGELQEDGGGICSLECIDALSAFTDDIKSQCSGVQTLRTTLIGLFFARSGVEYLCPNSVDGVGPRSESTNTSDAASTTASADAADSSSTESSTPPSSETTSSSDAAADPEPSSVDDGNDDDSSDDSDGDEDDGGDGGEGNPFELSGENATDDARSLAVPTFLFSITLFWLTALSFGVWV